MILSLWVGSVTLCYLILLCDCILNILKFGMQDVASRVTKCLFYLNAANEWSGAVLFGCNEEGKYK